LWRFDLDIHQRGASPITSIINKIDRCDVTRNPTLYKYNAPISKMAETLSTGNNPLDRNAGVTE